MGSLLQRCSIGSPELDFPVQHLGRSKERDSVKYSSVSGQRVRLNFCNMMHMTVWSLNVCVFSCLL